MRFQNLPFSLLREHTVYLAPKVVWGSFRVKVFFTFMLFDCALSHILVVSAFLRFYKNIFHLPDAFKQSHHWGNLNLQPFDLSSNALSLSCSHHRTWPKIRLILFQWSLSLYSSWMNYMFFFSTKRLSRKVSLNNLFPYLLQIIVFLCNPSTCSCTFWMEINCGYPDLLQLDVTPEQISAVWLF